MIKSAGLLVIKNSKALLVKPKNIDSDNNWSIPKGIIDSSKDKNIVETALRETFEETGIQIPFCKVDVSRRSIISYVDQKGILNKVIFYFIVEISDKDYTEYKITNAYDYSEIETFDFFSLREAKQKIYWKQLSALNFLKPDYFSLNELEDLIKLGYIYKLKHPTFPIWLYNITDKCKISKCWNYTTLSSRGLILDDTGRILARPFKKFFEKKDTYPEILDLLPNRNIKKDKVDGALGVAYCYKKNYYLCSKNSFKHYSSNIATDAFYNNFYHFEIPDIDNHTFLFEILSLKIPFTINYIVQDSLYPIGIVDNKLSKNKLELLDETKFSKVLNYTEFMEGFIEYYEDGTMIKYKTKDFFIEYELLKESKKRAFFKNSPDYSINIFNKRKVINQVNINLLKNLNSFFSSDDNEYHQAIDYWG